MNFVSTDCSGPAYVSAPPDPRVVIQLGEDPELLVRGDRSHTTRIVPRSFLYLGACQQGMFAIEAPHLLFTELTSGPSIPASPFEGPFHLEMR